MSLVPDATMPLDNLNQEATIIRIVIEEPNNRTISNRQPFREAATGEDVVQRLRQLYYKDRPLYRRLLEQYLICSEPAVFTAKVSRLSTGDLEAHPQHEVLIETKVVDIPLTKAFHRPSLLADIHNVSVAFGQYAEARRGTPDIEQTVCLVGLRLQPARIAVVMFSGLSFALVLGIIVGLVAHDAALGVAVGTGLGTCVFGMQGLLIWLLKRK